MSARLSEEDERWLKKSCAESGVPEKCTDPETILHAAEILKGSGK